jgi:hypothetical protein
MKQAQLILWGSAIAIVILFAAQNLTPAVPLVFLGLRTPAIPLGIWLGAALLLGAATTLILSLPDGKSSPAASSRQPRRAYRPPSERERYTPPPPQSSGSEFSHLEEDWTTYRPVSDWEDWGKPGQAPSPSQSQGTSRPPQPPPERRGWWPFGKRRNVQQQVAYSLQDIEQGWDGVDPGVRPRGASVVEDALDEIDQGWDDFDVPSDPQAAYPDAGFYASRPTNRVDNIYQSDPPQDQLGGQTEADEEEGEGVYDADYRVIIPPRSEGEETGDRA